MFYDIESSVYTWNPSVRKFGGLRGLWTYDHFSKQDVRYLEFLSGLPVQTLPYVWDPEALDHFVRDERTPSWSASARRVESLLPADAPRTMAWCARVIESNFSNTSHCTIPLNIVSEIRRRGEPIRFTVHNGEAPIKHAFFQNNIVKNLLLPDLSGNFVPRARLPDLRGDKTFLVAHQRFRPLKSYLLDALYLGIPMIHNCAMVRGLGAQYYYEGNQILSAVEAWRTMAADAASGSGFFDERKAEIRRAALVARFSPYAVSSAFGAAIQTHLPKPAPAPTPAPAIKNTVQTRIAVPDGQTLRVAFATMWDDFQPRHNFFMYLLSWVASQNGLKVELDEVSPNVVFFGPFSKGTEKKWPGVPKVYFTGENAEPNTDADTILNLGFRYEMDAMKNKERPYIRLPLWVLEVNWWGADPEKIVNPRPVSVAAATQVDPALLTRARKFCAFVATNPSNPNRNLAFHVLDKWRGVDAGGRLFCNLPSGPIPAGRGGGGGELAKVEFYKNYKFALTFENASSPGYTTEKLFHAKVAGAVPIYWGDPFVDRDFDPAGFLNANRVSKPEDLIGIVEKMASDEEAWQKAAAVPAVSEFKKRWCMNTMEAVARTVFERVLKQKVSVSSWNDAEKFGAVYEGVAVPAQAQAQALSPQSTRTPLSPQVPVPATRVFVTAANTKFLEAAVNALASLKAQDKECRRIVYVWPDVADDMFVLLKQHGASEVRRFPTAGPWSDYWEPQHFAWKLWIHKQLATELSAGTAVFYCDAGAVFAGPVEKIWRSIATDGVLLLEDDEQTNARWCHPTFCKNLSVTQAELAGQQLWAGGIGFLVGGAYDAVAKQAVEVANTRETIVGEKWNPYSATCLGHRHDQSILSILTARAGLPRQPLRTFYCDSSMRAAQQFGVPLYVHRGNFRETLPLAPGISEAYLINLARRKDRLVTFQKTHPQLKNAIYVLPAVDGRAIQLSPQLIHCFRDNDFGWKKSVMGCALSHLTLWEKLASDKLSQSYLILEDDVRLQSDWAAKWAAAAPSIPADADVIYLGGVLPPNKPALPAITEPVNSHFARVKKNSLYGGGAPRRYFHFCNYAYVLTKSGAQKMVNLVKERGIFTSGDHMIVNHGDSLLNIYFTTPLLATCFQDEDPRYQNSQFNDFSRVDEFDSDLWNNNERFSKEEILAVLGAGPRSTSAFVESEATQSWNDFLKAVALKRNEEIPRHLDAIFKHWSSMTPEEFTKHAAWFRVFEQLMLSKNPVLQTHLPQILGLIRAQGGERWKKVLESAVTVAAIPEAAGITLFHMKEVTPAGFLETDWIRSIFPAHIAFKAFENIGTLLEAQNPVVVYQKMPRNEINVSALFTTFARILAAQGKKMTVLHLSDEFGSDDIGFYEEAGVKTVIRNYWRPDLETLGRGKVLVVPLGFANGRGAAAQEDRGFEARPYVWSFAGSLDRPGRATALAALQTAASPHKVEAKETWSHPAKLDGPAYNAVIRESKFVPCFRGSKALESFRIYEALEHGAIPFYCAEEVGDDELKKVLGADHPLLGFPDWNTAGRTLPLMAARGDVMEKHRKQVMDWWKAKKQTVAAAVAAAL